MRRGSLWLAVGLVCAPCFAVDLVAPFSTESTQVLPAGVFSFQFYQALMNIDTRFDGGGGLEPLGFRLDQKVKWSDVLATQGSQAEKNLVNGILKAQGISPDSSPGNATGNVSIAADLKVPVLLMGITDKLMAGVIVPVISYDAQVATGFVSSSDGQAFVSAICQQSPTRCNAAANQLNNATATKLKFLGYNPLGSETVVGLGDIQLMAQYQWLGDQSSGLSTRMVLTLPTGIGPNPDNAMDLYTGDGRFKVGPTVLYDLSLFQNSRWNFYGGYTMELPNQMIRRLPAASDDMLSDDRLTLTRVLGSMVEAGTSFQYYIEPIAVKLGVGYSFQYETGSYYNSNGFDPVTQQRIGWLQALDPDQTLHAVIGTIGFSTVDWYMKKKFPLPFQVNVAYSHPFAGMNAPTNDVFTGEAVVFF
jgi:hypothetical protein